MIFLQMRRSGHILKIRHLHICIDDESYFALLSLQSSFGISKTKIIENLIKERKRENDERRVHEDLCKDYEI